MRSIFLHFINKEIHAVKGVKLDESAHIAAIKNCGLMTAGVLMAPFAQVTEFYWKKTAIKELIASLYAIGKLDLRNGSSDYYTFAESRQQLYGDHRSLYPMYFDRVHHNRGLYAASPCLDTTAYIKTTLLNAVIDPQKVGNLFSAAEILRLNTNATFIKNDFQEKPLAATFSIYQSSLIGPKPAETRYFGNASSRLFVNHYSLEHDLKVPTGYFNDRLIEGYDDFPFYDLQINDLLCRLLGIDHLLHDTAFHRPYINLVQDADFTEFCRIRMLMLETLARSVQRSGPTKPQLYAIADRMKALNFTVVTRSQPISAALLTDKLFSTMQKASKADPLFAGALEVMELNSKSMRPILLVTATDVEDKVFRSFAAVNGFSFIDIVSFEDFSASKYKSNDHLVMWHVRTSAGSAGVSGSARISERAIVELLPCFCFSVGIAFGIDQDKQKLCDVLVSEYIFSYEPAKVSPDHVDGRGPKIPCNSDVVTFSRLYNNIDTAFGVHTGGILSGEKLVNDAAFIKKLKEMDPKAIGGEMECAGLAQSTFARGVQFAMIKGIADFAVGKTDNVQESAAKNAFKFSFEMIRRFREAGRFTR